MRRSELHDDLLNNILVFLQLAVNGKTDNIFLMVSLRVCATAANKHKSGSKAVAKRDGRDSNYNHVSVQNYTVKQSCMHHAVIENL